MTITHEPVHRYRIPSRTTPRPPDRRPRAETASAPPDQSRHDTSTASVHYPNRNIRLDTTFWQHRSIFAGSQEQLNRLRREADSRAAARARATYVAQLEARRESERRQTFELHRPAIRRLKPILHVGFIPLLWAITTCKCGDRWPCNSIKQYFRSRVGWSVDITDHLDDATRRLPKPMTRLRRLRRILFRRSARVRTQSSEIHRPQYLDVKQFTMFRY